MIQKKEAVVKRVGPAALSAVSVGVAIGLTFWYRRQPAASLIVNHGVAFGVGADVPRTAEIGVIIALAVLGLLYWRWQRMQYPLGMMLGGAIANALSRILFGGVVDYWHVAPYPYVFNAADVAIRLGLVWVLMSFWINRRQTRPGTANDAPKVKES